MDFRGFGGTGWNGTASVVELGTQTTDALGEGTYYYYPTFDKAYDAAEVGDVIAPVPPMVVDGVQYGFFDSNGFPVQRVDVTLGANLTVARPVKIYGGAYRLRFNGAGTYYLNTTYHNDGGFEFQDVDFVNFASCAQLFRYKTSDTYPACLTRCLVANAQCDSLIYYISKGGIVAQDCAFIGVRKSGGTASAIDRLTTLRRCSIYSNVTTTNATLDKTVVDASGASFALSKGAVADVTDWSDWETTVDLRLASSATTYHSGNGLTSSDGDVYDAAGLKRSVDGAQGAYERLTDVTRWYKNGAWYSDASRSTVAAAPTSSDVCYIDANALFFDAFSSSKTYLAGWTRLFFADEVQTGVLGLQASISLSEVWYFDTAGWSTTNTVVDLGTRSTAFGTRRVKVATTLLKAVELAPAGSFVTPCPSFSVGSTSYGGSFINQADGFPYSRVDVTLGSNLTIPRSLRVCGGAFRLRLNGAGTYNVEQGAANASTFTDVDFVQMNELFGGSGQDSSLRLVRCFVAGCANPHKDAAWKVYAQDCAFVANKVPFSYGAAGSFTRCTVDNVATQTTGTDCVFIGGMTSEEVGAVGFVVAPKVADPDNEGYYTDETAWTNTDWSSVDLRWLSTSSYKTGGASVTSETTVYGLDGLPRKIGGALGAYEYYAITHVYCLAYSSYRYYQIENADGAPQVVEVWLGARTSVYKTGVPTRLMVVFDEALSAAGKIYFNNYDWGSQNVSAGALNFNQDIGGNTFSRLRIKYTDADAVSIVNLSASKGEGYQPIPRFNQQGQWLKYQSTRYVADAAPTSASVCLIDQNTEFADTDTTVGAILVSNRAHVKLGNNGGGAEVVVGLGSTVEFDGEITAKDLTETSEELLTRYNPTEGATFALDNCAISDASA